METEREQLDPVKLYLSRIMETYLVIKLHITKSLGFTSFVTNQTNLFDFAKLIKYKEIMVTIYSLGFNSVG